jgi:hypothetical protein
LASALSTIASTAGGMAALSLLGGSGVCWICCITTAIWLSAWNGKRPVSIS